MAKLTDNDIQVEFDEEFHNYYAIWQPMLAIGMGQTVREALEDLRAAARFGVETRINLKLNETS